MTASTLLPSEGPKLSEAARHLVIPEGIERSNWPRVERRLATVGVSFDPWQQGFGSVALGMRADGTYAATVGGIVVSIPRQVGKTFAVGHLLIALAIEFPGLRIAWTSHHNRTTTNTFRAMQAMVRREQLRQHMPPTRNLGIRTANGEQEIQFRNGSLIMFGAREHGFGRGLDAIDVLVLDEAQILGLKALEDMVPSTNQARHPHGALIFFIGTPPRPNDDGEAFTAKRKAALDGQTTDQFYIEMSADPDADPDDREQWRKANPSYPHRTPEESMLRMRANLPDEAAWRREALGIWDEVSTSPPLIPAGLWAACKTTSPPTKGRVAYGVKFSVDGSSVALAACRRPEGGKPHVEVVAHRSMSAGTGWLADWLEQRWSDAVEIVIDGKAGSGALVNTLRERGVPARVLRLPKLDEVLAAHTMILEAVRTGEVTHFDQPALNDVVAHAVKRDIGKAGGWGWQSTAEGIDVSLLDAVTLALHAAMTSKRRPGRKSKVRVMA